MWGMSAILSVNAPRFLIFSDVLWPSLILRETMFSAQIPPQAIFITSTVLLSPYVAIISTGMGNR